MSAMPFVLRHWTALLIALVVAGWALFYLPRTPSYAIFRLKQAIDARQGETAAGYVDFVKVVQSAGQEMMQRNGSAADSDSNLLGQLIGRAAVDLFSGPMAALLRQWAVQQVDNGAQQVQMPNAAVAGAVLLLHHDGNEAYTRWTDNKGQVWEVRLTREADGWKVTQVKNIRELLEKLRRHEEKEYNRPPEFAVPPEAPPSPDVGPPTHSF
jgi:hypothetical protein